MDMDKFMYQMTVPKDLLQSLATEFFVSKSDVEEFRKMWRRKGNSKKNQQLACRDQEAMNKSVESRFLYCGWGSIKGHKKDVKVKRKVLQRKSD
jgi:hypothetical protein